MRIQLSRPELEKFIEEQVSKGEFESPEAAVAAAVERMMLDRREELDEETIEAIIRAEDQLDQGKGIDFRHFAAQMRKKFAAQ